MLRARGNMHKLRTEDTRLCILIVKFATPYEVVGVKMSKVSECPGWFFACETHQKVGFPIIPWIQRALISFIAT